MAMAPRCVSFLVFVTFCALPTLIAAGSSEAPEPSPSPLADLHGNGTGEVPSSEIPPEPSPQDAENPSPPSPALSPSTTTTHGPEMSPFLAPGPATLPPSPSSLSAKSPGEQNGSPHLNSNSTFTVTWCAVRDELADCQYYVSLLNTGDYEWSCVRKQSAMECMEAIKTKEVDLITLDVGLAYIAFTNYTMKAIMAEEYCYHSKSYNAVAVVNKDMCDKNSKLSLEDFHGRRSCHPGYRTAAGWNYPVQYLVENGLQRPVLDSSMQRDEAIVNSFFSETCAPSEFEGTGLCTSCGNNGTCDASVSSIYEGYPGAFRCLMDEVGDIAFLRSDTALRLSNDGINAQNWSTKSVNDFMYLCPGGGCRPINDNIGSCSFGSVPANVIMTSNSQTNAKRKAIVKTLLNASWTDALYSGHNWEDHVLSASTQNLVEIRQLTRSYLGEAAVVAHSVESLQYTNISSLPVNGGHQLRGFSRICMITSLAIASLYTFTLWVI